MIVLLVLSIVVVGNFLRDGESNALEGGLLVVSLRSEKVAGWGWSVLLTRTICSDRLLNYSSGSLVLP
jgi:hypothetical protein